AEAGEREKLGRLWSGGPAVDVVLGRIEADLGSGRDAQREGGLVGEARRARPLGQAGDASRVEREAVRIAQVDEVRQCGGEARLLVDLARGGGERRFAGLAAAGKRLPESAPLRDAAQEQHL